MLNTTSSPDKRRLWALFAVSVPIIAVWPWLRAWTHNPDSSAWPLAIAIIVMVLFWAPWRTGWDGLHGPLEASIAGIGWGAFIGFVTINLAAPSALRWALCGQWALG